MRLLIKLDHRAARIRLDYPMCVEWMYRMEVVSKYPSVNVATGILYRSRQKSLSIGHNALHTFSRGVERPSELCIGLMTTLYEAVLQDIRGGEVLSGKNLVSRITPSFLCLFIYSLLLAVPTLRDNVG